MLIKHIPDLEGYDDHICSFEKHACNCLGRSSEILQAQIKPVSELARSYLEEYACIPLRDKTMWVDESHGISGGVMTCAEDRKLYSQDPYDYPEALLYLCSYLQRNCAA